MTLAHPLPRATSTCCSTEAVALFLKTSPAPSPTLPHHSAMSLHQPLWPLKCMIVPPEQAPLNWPLNSTTCLPISFTWDNLAENRADTRRRILGFGEKPEMGSAMHSREKLWIYSGHGHVFPSESPSVLACLYRDRQHSPQYVVTHFFRPKQPVDTFCP